MNLLSKETATLSIAVLGASGDLAKKSYSALFHLYINRRLDLQELLPPNEVHFIGYARSKISDDELRNKLRSYLVPEKGASSKQLDDVSNWLAPAVYHLFSPSDSEDGFFLLDKEISEQEYLKNSKQISKHLLISFTFHGSCLLFINLILVSFLLLADHGGWTRVVAEKPFGRDLESAEELNTQIGELFEEQQIYRIDHFYDEVVLGQYEGFRDDSTVPDESNTPTFATAIIRIHKESWEGKALESRKAEIEVQFKDVPGNIFRSMHYPYDVLVFSLYHAFIMHILLSVLYTDPESEIGVSYITVFTLEDKIIHTSVPAFLRVDISLTVQGRISRDLRYNIIIYVGIFIRIFLVFFSIAIIVLDLRR
ncbi:glucose-6-phosphate 1-dehydrogenase [Medicago truncatula]|uniref:glucose-6-phosphate dehydrogenase (NADP(+)) n=1 Tax=Medicago truncatula TaxID=3880 RepID=G7KRA5_MEDTR|nr:glucose-6-phosphate 1-dehydrogenase [Medicago truncatula]